MKSLNYAQLIQRIDEIGETVSKNRIRIKRLSKEGRKAGRDEKRAKNVSAKQAIRENKKAILSEVSALKRENEKLRRELSIIEYGIIEQELNKRKSEKLVKSQDLKSLKFRFSLRRFGNFTGYLNGRKEEIEDYLDENLLQSHRKRLSREIIENNPKISRKELINQVEERMAEINLDEIAEARENVIRKGLGKFSLDRVAKPERIFKSLFKNTEKAPKTPILDSLRFEQEEPEQEDETPGR